MNQAISTANNKTPNNLKKKKYTNTAMPKNSTNPATNISKGPLFSLEERIEIMGTLGTAWLAGGNLRVAFIDGREEVVRHEGETAKVAIRNLRRDANQQLKDAVKDKTISEDDERRAEDEIQKLTDKYVTEIDKLLAQKEQELMQI